MTIQTADAFMAIFGYQRVSSCYDCSHNQPQGCLLKRPEYETYTQCPEYDPDDTSQGIESENTLQGKSEKGESDES